MILEQGGFLICLKFGLPVKFGPSVRSSGKKYSAVRFYLFGRPVLALWTHLEIFGIELALLPWEISRTMNLEVHARTEDQPITVSRW